MEKREEKKGGARSHQQLKEEKKGTNLFISKLKGGEKGGEGPHHLDSYHHHHSRDGEEGRNDRRAGEFSGKGRKKGERGEPSATFIEENKPIPHHIVQERKREIASLLLEKRGRK